MSKLVIGRAVRALETAHDKFKSGEFKPVKNWNNISERDEIGEEPVRFCLIGGVQRALRISELSWDDEAETVANEAVGKAMRRLFPRRAASFIRAWSVKNILALYKSAARSLRRELATH